MNITICLAARTIYYHDGGGHFWVYMNWALGLKLLGCEIIWLEYINDETPEDEIRTLTKNLTEKLDSFGFSDRLALCTKSGSERKIIEALGVINISTAADKADILINQWYGMPQSILKKFKKTVFFDIDPGLTQVWMAKGYLPVASHDTYFTIGETVGKPGAKFPHLGLAWHYVPPCVALDNWPVINSPANSPYTTVTHWSMNLWEDDNGAGLLRFRNFNEAIKCIEEAEANNEKHCKLTRALAEEYFDAKKVAKSLLERVL